MEPVGELLPQILSCSGCVLLADPSERTRHNRCAVPLALAHWSCSSTICMHDFWAFLQVRKCLCCAAKESSERRRAAYCREYFVDMMQSLKRPMLLEECTQIEEVMDGKSYSIELMKFHFKEGSESVGVKRLLT